MTTEPMTTEPMTEEPKKRILIVDDQRLNINILTHILRDDYTIMAAPDGLKALKAAQSKTPPDLILLDVIMPELDGYETCRRLKADQATKDIPVIFVTALEQERDETLGFDVGAVDYITKPITPAVVKARVQTHIALEDTLSKLKENQEIIESRNAELDEMNQLKNKFIGMAAHDLRNPLVSISGFAEVLLSDPNIAAEDSTRYLNIIVSACRKMLDLISDILDVSVIDSGELNLNLGMGSLPALVAERIQIFEPIADRKEISLASRTAEVGDTWFDASRMAQVIDNMISNAIKYSPHNTTVHISLTGDDDLLEISVRDEGPGISAEDQSRIFNDFQKLAHKPTGGETSTGLGLAIAKRMVEAHQGKLMVDSETGQGATFSVVLPRRPT